MHAATATKVAPTVSHCTLSLVCLKREAEAGAAVQRPRDRGSVRGGCCGEGHARRARREDSGDGEGAGAQRGSEAARRPADEGARPQGRIASAIRGTCERLETRANWR